MSLNYMQLNNFAAAVERHHTTVNNWFNDLEKRKIHYVNRANNQNKERVFDDLDLELAKYIANKRDQSWSMAAIYSELKDQTEIQLREFPIDYDHKPNNELSTVEQFDEFKNMFFSELSKEMQDLAAAITKNVKMELEHNQEKLQLEMDNRNHKNYINKMLTEKKIENRLYKEAVDQWNTLPSKERYSNKLLKIVDMEKREDYIKNYVSENFEKSLRNEFPE